MAINIEAEYKIKPKKWKRQIELVNHQKITELDNNGGINLANYRSAVRKRQSGSNKPVNPGDNPEVTRVRTPRKDRNEVLATVASLLGSKRVTLQCMDGVVRMGRIPGSKNKKMWIREGDIVIANPWEIQDSKADVIWKYTRPQVDWLERKGYLN